ncbi:MAG: hypothetical protein COA78_06675 [Blastopirellula sp.]|nr:MAG: hypothetical protein COA78_06675 [Blastopirellula sp.]
MKSTLSNLLFLSGLLILCSGCGESKEDLLTKIDLQHIGLQYHNFIDIYKSVPTDEEHFLSYDDPYGFKEGQQVCKAALDSGNYVVLWSYDVRLDLKNNSQVILGYQKDVPEKGGYVLFADGSAKKLTKEEFTGTSKAEPTVTSQVEPVPRLNSGENLETQQNIAAYQDVLAELLETKRERETVHKEKQKRLKELTNKIEGKPLTETIKLRSEASDIRLELKELSGQMEASQFMIISLTKALQELQSKR